MPIPTLAFCMDKSIVKGIGFYKHILSSYDFSLETCCGYSLSLPQWGDSSKYCIFPMYLDREVPAQHDLNSIDWAIKLQLNQLNRQARVNSVDPVASDQDLHCLPLIQLS